MHTFVPFWLRWSFPGPTGPSLGSPWDPLGTLLAPLGALWASQGLLLSFSGPQRMPSAHIWVQLSGTWAKCWVIFKYIRVHWVRVSVSRNMKGSETRNDSTTGQLCGLWANERPMTTANEHYATPYVCFGLDLLSSFEEFSTSFKEEVRKFSIF